MGYQAPTDAPVSSSWQDHRNRNPPSAEPGTDYACGYGTDLAIAGDGTVSVVDPSPAGGEGRRLSVDLDDGRRVSYLHLDRMNAYVGQRVNRGQTGVAWSGASGNGNDWWYGPHVHVSLWDHPGMPYSATRDFQPLVGPADPPPYVPPPPENVGGNMFIIYNQSNPSQKILVTVDGGQFRGRYLEDATDRAVVLAVSPKIPEAQCDNPTFDAFLANLGYVYGQPIPLVPVDAAAVSAVKPSTARRVRAVLWTLAALGALAVLVGGADLLVAVYQRVILG